jgi:hypothetical protein
MLAFTLHSSRPAGRLAFDSRAACVIVSSGMLTPPLAFIHLRAMMDRVTRSIRS